MADVPQLTFLPVPRIPLSVVVDTPDPEWLDALHPGGGEFIRGWRALHAGMLAAIYALEAGRPGGSDWGVAMAADADAVIAGKHPKVWATAELLAGDHHRWALASAEARTLVARVTTLRASAPAAALIKAATDTVEALKEPLAMESEAAYLAAVRGDSHRAEAWTHYDAATAMALNSGRHRALVAWLDGRDQAFDVKGWGAPASPETRGFFLVAGYILKPGERPIMIPQGVKWPDNTNLPNIPIGAKGVALREQGWADPDLPERTPKPPKPGTEAAKIAALSIA